MNKQDQYAAIEKDFLKIVAENPPWEAALVSLIALLKEGLSYVTWVGVYRLVEETLWIGPYQGKVACAQIPAGRGVCGTAVVRKKPIVVRNVEDFPGHIACDPKSQSELVIPVEYKKKILGVLDLDSHDLAAFDQVDVDQLTEFLGQLENLRL
ncbi:MAG: GAF domain-containing protein [Pseudomonadota bacterium]